MTYHRVKTREFQGIRLFVNAVLIAGFFLAAMPVSDGRAVAIHYVTKTVDTIDGTCDTDCSLREAIIASHGGDTIDFDLPPGSTVNITLGSIDTLKSFTISSSVDNITIDAGNSSRIFYFWGGSTVLLNNLTLANGSTTGGTHGGAIQNTSNLTLTDVTINTSTADGNGGGIYSGYGSNLTLDNVTLYDNHADQGGGIYFRDNASGTMTITKSIFSSNDALEGNGGGLHVLSGDVNITFTTFDSNTASRTTGTAAYGGGIYSYMGGADSITINYSHISNNTADHISVINYRGGGIFLDYGTMNINKTTINNNTSYMGGGIYIDNDGTLNVLESTISGNLATYGSGGIANYGSLNMTNSTISGNKANVDPGALYTQSGATTNLNNVTITANVADFDSNNSGITGGFDVNHGTITIRNTIIAGNTENTGSTSQVDCVIIGESFTSGGYNLVGIADGCYWVSATGDQLGTLAIPIDPLLGVLSDNGGPTYTHSLGGGSLAIEGGNIGGCKDHNATAITIDQRGALRPSGVHCDIGAYEIGSVPKDETTTDITHDNDDPSVSGQTVTVQYIVTSDGVGTPTGTVTVTDSLSAATCNSSVATGQCDIGLPTAGARLLTATYSGDSGHNGSADNESHTVNKAATTTTVTSDNPDPSIENHVVTVTYTVTANSPGSGTPTGTVFVTDNLSSETCSASVAAGQCELTMPNTGSGSVTANYQSDSNFDYSSDSDLHTSVNAIPFNDFDGDFISDPAKFYASTGTVWWLKSSTSTWDSAWLGPETFDYVPRSDFDGDGKTDPGKFNATAGTIWYIRSSDSTWEGQYLGVDSYTYHEGADFDGDGKTDPTKLIPNGAIWYIKSSTDLWEGFWLGPEAFEYVTGDFDGDGLNDPAKFIADPGVLWYWESSTSGWVGIFLGSDAYEYVSGSDFDGDGKSDPAKFYASTNTVWWLKSTTSIWDAAWMGPGTFDFVGGNDFDGDGKTDPAKYDPVTGILSWLKSTTTTWDSADLGTDTYELVN